MPKVVRRADARIEKRKLIMGSFLYFTVAVAQSTRAAEVGNVRDLLKASRDVRRHAADVAARGAHCRAGRPHLLQRGGRGHGDGAAVSVATVIPMNAQWFEQTRSP